MASGFARGCGQCRGDATRAEHVRLFNALPTEPALTPGHVRQLMRAIDEADDSTTLARLAHVIARR
jgi:hypothetical protein